MPKLEIKDAVDLLYKQTTVINGLWQTFAVAGLAAGGFTALNGAELGTRIFVAVALTGGFGTFAIGNCMMLQSEIRAREAVAQALKHELDQPDGKTPYSAALEHVVETAASPKAGFWVHVLIDVAVGFAIWTRVFFFR